jgi:Glycosyltransferase family 87
VIPGPARPRVVTWPTIVGPLASSRRVRLALLLAWVTSIVVLLLQTFHKAGRPHGTDLSAYLFGSHELVAGRNPYTVDVHFPYVYPLLLAFLLVPATWLPYGVAVFLWFVLALVSLVTAARLTADLAWRELGVPREAPVGALLVVLWFRLFDPIQNTLRNGQVDFLVLVLCVAFLHGFLAGRRVAAAVCLALAITIKLTPTLLLLFVVLRRDLRTFLLCLSFTGLFLFSPYLLVGRDIWQHYETYLASFVLPGLGSEWPSPRGVYFTPSGFLSYVAPAWARSGWARALGAVLPLAMLTAVEGLGRGPRSGARDVWTFAMYLLVMLLLTPVSEVHHLAYLFPAAGLLTLVACTRPDCVSSLTGMMLASVWALLWLGLPYRGGPFFFLAIVLLAVLVVTMQRTPSPVARAA